MKYLKRYSEGIDQKDDRLNILMDSIVEVMDKYGISYYEDDEYHYQYPTFPYYQWGYDNSGNPVQINIIKKYSPDIEMDQVLKSLISIKTKLELRSGFSLRINRPYDGDYVIIFIDSNKGNKMFPTYRGKINESSNEENEWRKYFQILSVKYDNWKILTPDHIEFNDCIEDCIENAYQEDIIEIQSVKRISDGEIFSLGDTIIDSTGTSDPSFGKITKIWPSFNQMRADIGRIGIVLNNYYFKK